MRLIRAPDPEYIEYHETESENKPPIKAGMLGEVNVILSNGNYHVEIFDENGISIAYAPMDEESLEAVE